MKFLAKRLRWMLVGAGAAWLLDPERGAQRRAMISERARSLLGQAGFAASSEERAVDPDVVTDTAWASAQDVRTDVDERRLATSGSKP